MPWIEVRASRGVDMRRRECHKAGVCPRKCAGADGQDLDFRLVGASNRKAAKEKRRQERKRRAFLTAHSAVGHWLSRSNVLPRRHAHSQSHLPPRRSTAERLFSSPLPISTINGTKEHHLCNRQTPICSRGEFCIADHQHRPVAHSSHAAPLGAT